MGAVGFVRVQWDQRHGGTGKQGNQGHRWSRNVCLVRLYVMAGEISPKNMRGQT